MNNDSAVCFGPSSLNAASGVAHDEPCGKPDASTRTSSYSIGEKAMAGEAQLPSAIQHGSF
jgi:hypothetical protein